MECTVGVVRSLINNLVMGIGVISKLRNAVLVEHTVDRRHAVSSLVVYIAERIGVVLRLLIVSLREL